MKKSKFPPPKKDYIFKPNIKHNWSEYQKNIFRNIARETGHLIVEARAGSAKSTSLIESFKYVPREKNKRILALAFNRSIRDELVARSPSYAADGCFTFHSLGFRAIKQRFGEVELDNNKVFDLVKNYFDDKENIDLINNICDTIGFCKYSLKDSPQQIDNIVDNYGIDLCDLDRKEFINAVIKVLGQDKLLTSKIDYNDMCWFPFVYNLPLGQYAYVYVDEYQDLNLSQLFMAKKACAPDGRIIIFGDEFQDLYSWRGSDASIVLDLKKQSTTKILPLPISYRCPKNIISLAQKWVPDITCPDTAINGEIEEITLNQIYNKAKPGCFILSRTNAPLIKICLQFIRNGIKANIRGRDVGGNLKSLIRRSKKKQIPAFIKWLDNWKDDEVAKLKQKKLNIENVLDKHECLINICDECKDLKEVCNKIDSLFNDADEKNIIILSSVHRSKGLQADDVFFLKWTSRIWFDHIDEDTEKPDENFNIIYVAITRCVKRLFIVHKSI